MIDQFLNPANWWMWVIAALVIGITVLHIIPKLLRRAVEEFYLTKYAVYYSQKLWFEHAKLELAKQTIDQFKTTLDGLTKTKGE